MKPVLSVRELARILKLSPATVSLALRGLPPVSAATRQRVLDVARDHHFRPDPLLSHILSRPSGRVKSIRNAVDIAYLHNTDDADPIHNAYWLSFLKNVQESAIQRGFTVADFNIRHYKSVQSLQGLLYKRGFRAIVLGPFITYTSLATFDWSPFVVVAIGRTVAEPHFTTLRRDEAAAIRLTWKKIMAAGYQRPGYFLHRHDPMVVDDEDRLGAWLLLRDQFPDKMVVPPLLAGFGKSAELEAWYRTYKPDVIIGFNAGEYWELHDAGIKVPEDVAYVQLHALRGDTELAGVYDSFDSCAPYTIPVIEQLIRTRRFGITPWVHDMVLVPEWAEGPSLPTRLAGIPSNKPNAGGGKIDTALTVKRTKR